MASAAAVAADLARSPLGAEVDEANGIVSTITANDEEHTGLTSDEDEDDVPSRARRPQRPVAAEDDGDGGGQQEDVDGDLFGDEEKSSVRPRRTLDDEQLDSGDDEDRDDREGEQAEEVEMVAQERQVQDVEYPRLPHPAPTDGEMYVLKVPKFFSIDAHSFAAEEFKPPAADHHLDKASKNFSASHTALTTVRWRHSPSDPSSLQSNARINRWSDGSLTVQFASQPTVQYEINGNALAPPQRDPVIPTPTSIPADSNKKSKADKFDPTKHAWTYLVAPMPSRGLARVTNVLTTGLTVSPPADYIDEAIANLQSDLAAAAGPKRLNGHGAAVGWTDTIEDPELAKKRAEQAEREKLRARKKQEAQQERERDRTNRALGRSGLSSQRYGGLDAGSLEDDDEGLATTRGRSATKPKAARRRRANSEYSSEEDYGRRGFKASKEDDYDEEDDFVAGSDEEEEVADEEEDEDDGIIAEGRAARRETTPKRGRDVDDEEDAEGEVDDAPAPGAERKKRRLVVADDDEEDE